MNAPLKEHASWLLDRAPVLVAGANRAAVLETDGTVREVTLDEAAAEIGIRPAPIVCHAPSVARRLGVPAFPALDVLELFAFVRPAAFCRPTPGGIADALELEAPKGHAAEAQALADAVRALLTEISEPDFDPDGIAASVAHEMAKGGWAWGEAVCGRLPARNPEARGLEPWRTMQEWAEEAPMPPPGSAPVAPEEARARLAALTGAHAEPRPQQADYASALCAAFTPRPREDEPNVVIAEAGTGVGKTLGYLAPATLWAEKNAGPVWISTYTRNLQRQIDGELDRHYPDPVVKAAHVVVRKGRENYLCLLNLEDAVRRVPNRASDAVGLGLMARWAAASRDGDMQGGDMPAWLPDLIGRRNTLELSDRRGECIYSACPHYHKCFIERTVRRARRADIVIANHALVMAQAALGGLDDSTVPDRLVFDEGHHVFDAADSAFSAELSGQEGADLRHWLLGAEAGRSSRARGLKRRIEDVALTDEPTATALAAVLRAARALPAPGWRNRMVDGAPLGPAEDFLAQVRVQVRARTADDDDGYGQEAEVAPVAPEVAAAAHAFRDALGLLHRPMAALRARLLALLEEQAAELDTPTRYRIESVARGLNRRAATVDGWRGMLDALDAPRPEAFVDWFEIVRANKRDLDVAMRRHWLDPAEPFAKAVVQTAHGVAITSATLRDGTGDPEKDWAAAEVRTGARHLMRPAIRAHARSPFDYAGRTRVFIVNDIDRNSVASVSAAYRELILAAGGGTLGLFTAIQRLRRVYDKIAPALDEAGIPLLAQHVDNMNLTSLIDIFRSERDTCLLGTDAVRDGVDVPGASLRLIVFDRVPWPRPTILHRERRKAFGGAAYDDMLARLRMKQAYGRLIRRADDFGVFVMLDRMLPSRLLGALPPGVSVERTGLADTIAKTRAFLAERMSGA